MNFKARVRLFMSQFKMQKHYYLQLEKIFENKDSGIYVFHDDGLIIATNKRQDVEQGIRATLRGNRVVENYPRGIAITEEGLKIVHGMASEDFINVMRTIIAFNKEFYARGYTKNRRTNSNWGQRGDHRSSDQRKPSEDRNRGTERDVGAKKGA